MHPYKRITGSGRLTFAIAVTIAPGPLATYVLLCPRISASSLTPPNEMRWNGLPKAFASEEAMEVFPHPGGPTNNRIGPFVFVGGLCLGGDWRDGTTPGGEDTGSPS